jgi:carbon storage regulator
MLVLSRRVGERLFIGNDIVVTIIDVRSDGVRVGIDAPREIRVTRAEIFEAVERHNVEAASADDSALEKLRELAPKSTPSPAPAATPKSTPSPAPAAEAEAPGA